MFILSTVPVCHTTYAYVQLLLFICTIVVTYVFIIQFIHYELFIVNQAISDNAYKQCVYALLEMAYRFNSPLIFKSMLSSRLINLFISFKFMSYFKNLKIMLKFFFLVLSENSACRVVSLKSCMCDLFGNQRI